ncbi:hypothetical protein GCM10020220_010020 [Nonomuraea rubra]|uniref:hypothetical protein n=1 Tax=Nonomuraea rubra TaxID=46180 RepID=UPI0031E87724
MALASTVFFGVPVGEARGSVALYLVITMLPFGLLAPFVGPILDRFRSGRRYVMAGTLFGRGLLCFAMAAAVGPGDLRQLFIGALGVLVLSKAYNVSRAAIMPSVLPADITLVSANARVALFTLVSAGVAVPGRRGPDRVAGQRDDPARRHGGLPAARRRRGTPAAPRQTPPTPRRRAPRRAGAPC